MAENNIETVLTKYIKGGKEVVKYNTLTGDCTLVVIKGDKETVKKEFKLLTNK